MCAVYAQKGEPMSKKLNDALRVKYVDVVKAMLANLGEEVLQVGSNEVAIPVVDAEGNDQYVVFTVKVPSGSRDGDAYDAYERAEAYNLKLKEAAEKRKAAAEAKAKKIAHDEQVRAERAAAKQARKAE